MPNIGIEAGTHLWSPFSDAGERDGETDHVLGAKLRNWFILLFLAVMAIETLVVLILLFVLPRPRPRNRSGPLKTLIVLGSGGHTAEMLKLVLALDKQMYTPRTYVTAKTDTLSGQKAITAEQSFHADGEAHECDLWTIPRSREVGQSYLTSVFTTLRAIWVAFVMVWQTNPDMILVNGPGTCIPLCIAAFVYRAFCVKWCDIVYVESIARVKKLSLSGWILYKAHIADVFMVQWPDLVKRYPRAVFADRLY